MRTIKPACLSAMTQSFEYQRKFYMGTSILTHIPLNGSVHLGAEQTLWPLLADFAPGFIEDAITRTRSEFLLYGHAYPVENELDAMSIEFGLRLGDLAKKGRAFGQRVREGSRLIIEKPAPRTALSFANAYGGMDYPYNPLGTGHPSSQTDQGHIHLPLIELMTHPWQSEPDDNHSALFTPLDVEHPERKCYAGTYDDDWLKSNYPGLPQDASRKIFNTAPPDQQIDEAFSGNETFDLVNLCKHSRHIHNKLPSVSARVFIQRKGQAVLEDLPVALRTVLFLPDADRLVLVWQARCQVEQDDASDIELLMVACEHTKRPKTTEHYKEVFKARMDEDDGIMAMLDDTQLVPEDISYDALIVPEPAEEPDPDSLSERQRRKTERVMQDARAEAVAAGLDPDEHAPPAHLPPPPKLPALPELGAYFRQVLKDAEIEQEKAKKHQQKVIDEAEALYKEKDMDFNIIRKEMDGEGSGFGPPQAIAPGIMETLTEADKEADARDAPVEEIKTMLNDAQFKQQWVTLDQQMLEGYRLGAHYQKVVPKLSSEKTRSLRDIVQQRLANKQGLQQMDLTGADLTEMDLSGVDCSGVLLDSANLQRANLQKANFTNAVLAHADLREAQLQGCDFSSANLGKAKLEFADATGAIFVDAELSETLFSRVVMRHAVLQKVQLVNTRIIDSDLSNADLTDAVLYECDFTGSSFVAAKLDEAQFVDCIVKDSNWQNCIGTAVVFLNIEGAYCDFRGAQLPGSRWVGTVNLTGAKFDHAQLEQAYFAQESVLCSTCFEGINAKGCDFTACNMTRANLKCAQLREASLRRACLKQADLTEADLMNASLQNSQLQGCLLEGAHLYAADLARIYVDSQTRAQNTVRTKARIYPRWNPAAKPS